MRTILLAGLMAFALSAFAQNTTNDSALDEWGRGKNPILPGYHADPEVLYSNKTKKYYIYSTTDGVPGWGGYDFSVFSSTDLVNWTDEGKMLDAKSNQVSWADGNAWAPCIIERKEGKNYKYYFYFSANNPVTDRKEIGCAVSDSPTGPFVDTGHPVITDKIRPQGVNGGQSIDVDVFQDPVSKKYYLYWGNCFFAGAELNDDMTSIKTETLVNLTPKGGTLADYEFREGAYVFYRNGKYYFLWSVDDTGADNYHVAYGTSRSPLGPIEVAKRPIVLRQAPQQGIYGPAHNSVLQVPGKDEWYIVYHRINPNFRGPNGSPGNHRQVCIDRMYFDQQGNIIEVKPTNCTVEEETSTFCNPLLDYGPDPWAIYVDGYYYYMHTMIDKIVLWRTKDITDLRNAEQKTIWAPTDPSNSRDLWAPEIHHINGKWYVLYAADDGNSDNHQLYCLENTSKDPMRGSFKMKGRVQTDPDSNWAIDGSYFEHRGELYMVWSGWETRRVSVESQCIYIAKMKNPWTLESERVQISRPVLEWERQYKNVDGSEPDHVIYVNEGPQPLVSPDGSLVHVIYSASGCWTPYYKLGCLTAPADADLLNPSSWTKSSKPLFAQSAENGVFGTGHNSFFRSPDGKQDFILYHARNTQMDPPGLGDTRCPRAQPFTWTRDGYPYFGTPLPNTQRLAKPSGQ